MGPLILFGNNRRRLFFFSPFLSLSLSLFLGVRVQVDQGLWKSLGGVQTSREVERERESEMTEIMWRRSRLT